MQPDSRKPLWSIVDYQSVTATAGLSLSFSPLLSLVPYRIFIYNVRRNGCRLFVSVRFIPYLYTRFCSSALKGVRRFHNKTSGRPRIVVTCHCGSNSFVEPLVAERGSTLSRNQIRRSSTGFRHDLRIE